jgi:hypothetical protein
VVLDAVLGFAGEDEGARSCGALARPVRGERAYCRALACAGRVSPGQCRARASQGCAGPGSLCCVDAPGQGFEERGRPERELPKVAGMVRFDIV